MARRGLTPQPPPPLARRPADEVESLSAARTAAVAGSEPSDAIRVVNALLTELDRLKRHENVLILTTSNSAETPPTTHPDPPRLTRHRHWLMRRPLTSRLSHRRHRHCLRRPRRHQAVRAAAAMPHPLPALPPHVTDSTGRPTALERGQVHWPPFPLRALHHPRLLRERARKAGPPHGANPSPPFPRPQGLTCPPPRMGRPSQSWCPRTTCRRHGPPRRPV